MQNLNPLLKRFFSLYYSLPRDLRNIGAREFVYVVKYISLQKPEKDAITPIDISSYPYDLLEKAIDPHTPKEELLKILSNQTIPNDIRLLAAFNPALNFIDIMFLENHDTDRFLVSIKELLIETPLFQEFQDVLDALI
jgi:hypothetical protein